jgi:iron complex outermembrane receptor protein
MNGNRIIRQGMAVILTITAILGVGESRVFAAQPEPAAETSMPDRAPPVAALKLPGAAAQATTASGPTEIIIPPVNGVQAKVVEPGMLEVKWSRIDAPLADEGKKENTFKLPDSERLARPVSSLVLVAQPKLVGAGSQEPAQPPQQPAQQPPQQPAQPETGPSAASLIGLPSVSSSSASATATQAAAAVSQGTSSVVSGQSAVPSTGVGDLLGNSASAQGVEVQRRSPLVGDPRIEGLHFGQVVTQADGGFWFPGRVDLDSVVSKLNSSDIQNILIVKGPFSVRYGPGFSFLDIESVATPRSKTGSFDAHGSTSANYRTNGQGVQAQQTFWGGNTDWGFRLSYDVQSAGNYSSGDGTQLPSSYNNQFVNFAFGMDLSPKSSLEVRYLHVQQSNVLFPGLLTDVNELATDAFTARYQAKDGPWYDRFTLDTWINGTTFNGDSANPATRAQIPQLDNIIPASNPANAAFAKFFPVRLDITTNGNSLSYGARAITTWGDPKGLNVSAGADFRVFSSAYNEFDAFNLSVYTPPGTVPGSQGLPLNLGIPGSRQIDPGLLVDASIPVGEQWIFKTGARGDITSSQFLGFGPNFDVQQYNQLVGDPQGDRNFYMYSGFATAEYKITPELTAQSGYGYAQRAPTSTELYAGGAFLGLIQNGLNSIYGDPNLRKEQMHQLNLSLNAKYQKLRAGGSAFYSFVPNYITYNNLGAFQVPVPGIGVGTTPINRLQFVNTPLATLYGFDAYGEYDAFSWLTPFATLLAFP